MDSSEKKINDDKVLKITVNDYMYTVECEFLHILFILI